MSSVPLKFALQEDQYTEPYHHYVSLQGKIHKLLFWGLEYFGYVRHVMTIINSIPFRTLAEVGCGDGKILLELSKTHPQASFVGYDLAPQAVAFAKAYGFGQKNLSFRAEDFSGAEHSYDVVTCIETLEHIPDENVEKFVATLYSKMHAASRLIISVPSINIPLNKKHYRHYTPELLQHQLNGFRLERLDWVHNTYGSRWIQTLLSNRLFILEFSALRKILFAKYVRNYLKASSSTGAHIVAIYTKVAR